MCIRDSVVDLESDAEVSAKVEHPPLIVQVASEDQCHTAAAKRDHASSLIVRLRDVGREVVVQIDGESVVSLRLIRLQFSLGLQQLAVDEVVHSRGEQLADVSAIEGLSQRAGGSTDHEV